jgi:hypothetical protein
MASTWSALKVELQGTGDNSGTWGTLTNANLGDAVLGEAITGSATVDFPADADVTITLTDVATTQAARNLRLNITESGAGVASVRNLILGSGCQIEKFYLIRNNGTGVKTIKNTSGTGVAVAAGKATLVYNDGTNVVDVLNSFSSAILGAENAGSIIPFYFANQAAFPSASTYHGAIAHSHADGAMYFAHSGAWVRMLNDSGPLGTPSSGTATNLTGLPLTTGVTGTLPVANGGTGITSLGTGVATFLGTPSSANLAAAVTGETGTGALVFATSPTLVTPALGTPTALILTSATGLPLSSGVTGILPVANGGTATATPSLVQGSNITITGTWPNQTIAAAAPGTGTVTSVSGTGTVNGLTLSGTVTSSGNITLGGTLSGIANAALSNSSVTVSAGTGMSGGGAVALGSSITLTNAGVTSIVAGTGISISGATGAVTVTSTVAGGSQVFVAFGTTGESNFASQGF